MYELFKLFSDWMALSDVTAADQSGGRSSQLQSDWTDNADATLTAALIGYVVDKTAAHLNKINVVEQIIVIMFFYSPWSNQKNSS